MITTQRNRILGITFRTVYFVLLLLLFSSWWMLKTLSANQKPPNFNELKHLKWQTTTAGRAYNKDNIVVYWYGVTAIFSVVTILEFLDTLKKIYIHIAISLCNAIFDIMRENCHKKRANIFRFSYNDKYNKTRKWQCSIFLHEWKLS